MDRIFKVLPCSFATGAQRYNAASQKNKPTQKNPKQREKLPRKKYNGYFATFGRNKIGSERRAGTAHLKPGTHCSNCIV